MSDYKPMQPQAQKLDGSNAMEMDGTTAPPHPWPERRKWYEQLLDPANPTSQFYWRDMTRALRDCLNEIDRLTATPSAECWKKLVELAYQTEDGVALIHQITASYNQRGEKIDRRGELIGRLAGDVHVYKGERPKHEEGCVCITCCDLREADEVRRG